MMNIDIIETEILKAIDVEKETMRDLYGKIGQESLEDIRKFVVELFTEYREGVIWWHMMNL